MQENRQKNREWRVYGYTLESAESIKIDKVATSREQIELEYSGEYR